MNKPLVFLHLSGADWQAIQPVLDAGHMPNLNALVDRGAMGNLILNKPITSPSVTARMASGVPSIENGILVPTVVAPAGFAPYHRRTQAADWTAAPIWEHLADHGRDVAAVGWPVTYPATAFSGLVVSDRFADVASMDPEDWPFDPLTVSDPSLAEDLAELRMHPAEVDHDIVVPFVPEVDKLDQDTDDRLGMLMLALSRLVTMHSAATWIAAERQPDVLMVHFDFLSEIATVFNQYRSPRMGHVTQMDHSLYRHVCDAAYRFMDMILGAYVQIAGADGYLILASDHGYHLDADRTLTSNSQHADKLRAQRRALGLIAMVGPGIRHDMLAHGTQLRDVAPTISALAGAPLSPLWQGRVLDDMFETPLNVRTAEHAVPFAPGFHADDTKDSVIRHVQLAKLGVLSNPPSDEDLGREFLEREWHLARMNSHITAGNQQGIIDEGHEVLARAPEHFEAHTAMIAAKLRMDDVQGARDMLDDLHLLQQDTATYKIQAAMIAKADNDMDETRTLLTEAEARLVDKHPNAAAMSYVGMMWLDMKEHDAAMRLFDQALELDENSLQALRGKCQVHLIRKEAEAALQTATLGIGCSYAFPPFHVIAARAHIMLENLPDAEAAFERALSMEPDNAAARQGLSALRKATAKTVLRQTETPDD